MLAHARLSTRNRRLIPYSTATNAYDLLSDVVAAILEEPKRFDMRDWYLGPSHTWKYRRAQRPACGTIACIAGWTVALAQPTDPDSNGPTRALLTLLGEELPDLGPEREAQRKWAWRDFYSLFHQTSSDLDAGTQAYAEDYAAQIRRLQERYRDLLVSVPVTPWTPPASKIPAPAEPPITDPSAS